MNTRPYLSPRSVTRLMYAKSTYINWPKYLARPFLLLSSSSGIPTPPCTALRFRFSFLPLVERFSFADFAMWHAAQNNFSVDDIVLHSLRGGAFSRDRVNFTNRYLFWATCIFLMFMCPRRMCINLTSLIVLLVCKSLYHIITSHLRGPVYFLPTSWGSASSPVQGTVNMFVVPLGILSISWKYPLNSLYHWLVSQAGRMKTYLVLFSYPGCSTASMKSSMALLSILEIEWSV